MRLNDRKRAGQRLARQLKDFSCKPSAIVLALPRGGVLKAHPVDEAVIEAVAADDNDLPEADEVFCLMRPSPFYGVGQWYERFEQVSDDEVKHLLGESQNFAIKPERSEADACARCSPYLLQNRMTLENEDVRRPNECNDQDRPVDGALSRWPDEKLWRHPL